MSFNSEMIRLLSEMLRLLKAQEHRSDAPSYEPEPFVPEIPKKNESWLESHQRKMRDDVRAGRAVSMNALGHRAMKRRRPPRAPGMQVRRWSGYHWHY